MTFPVRSTTTTAFGTAATSHNVNMPATVAAGDLLIMWFFMGPSPGTVTEPSGWTRIAQGICQLCWKIADGTEGGTTADFVTLNAIKAAANVDRITGWRNGGGTVFTVPGGGIADVYYADTGPPGTQPDPPSNTPDPGAEDYLWLVMGVVNTSSANPTFPTNYTSGVTASSGGSGSASTKVTGGVAERALNTTVQDPGAFTFGTTNTSWYAITMAIRPVSAASQVPYRNPLPPLLAQ